MRRHLAAAVLLAVAAVAVLVARPWDPRISTAAAERALRERVAGALRVDCDPREAGATAAMADVDFICAVRFADGDLRPFWVGSGWDGMSAWEPAAP